jgi:membrane protease YdiL (CAAX protease family)
MLSAKPWKADAIMRLILSLIICFLGGSLLTTALCGPDAATSKLKFYSVLAPGFSSLVATLALLHRPWKTERFVRRLTIFLLCFYAGLVLGVLAQKMAAAPAPSVGQMIIAALSLQGAALLLMIPFLREHVVTWSEAFGLRHHRWRAILLGLIVAALFLPLGYSLQWLSGEIMVRLRFKPELQQAVQTLQMSHSIFGRLVFGLLTALVVPPAEEMLFRGILYPWIKRVGFPRLALWGTSLLFGAVHFNVRSFVPLTVLALFLSLLYERTENLLAPIMTHATFNASNFAWFCLMEGWLNWNIR